MTNEADGLAVVLADLIRPIIGIDCRSGEEAHAIMCDRIKHKFAALSTPAARMLAGEGAAVAFQQRVKPWMMECFGAEISGDMLERADRFTEEALELAQTMPGFTAARAHALVDYVFGRDVGERQQEVGGVMVTLAALCLAAYIDMHEAGEIELARILQPHIVEKIRAKQAAKPTGSALPVAHPPAAEPVGLREAVELALACTPQVRDGEIIYDCGDPWEILRAALQKGPSQ